MSNKSKKSMSKDTNLYKPLLKWVGGKTQIIEQLIVKFPKYINNYHELFLGGASVLFRLLFEINSGNIKLNNKIYAYDINDTLIHVYKNIQSKHNELFEFIQQLITDFNNITGSISNRNPDTITDAKTSKESFYYWIRKQYNILSTENKKTIIGSSYFIFLNKTCFRGLYRTNSKGEFNVPYGNYKNPEIINYEHLVFINNIIKDVIFIQSHFEKSIKNIYLSSNISSDTEPKVDIENNDFIYMDPPYAPENNKSFVSYSEHGFDINEHNKLFKECIILHTKDFKYIMSNSDVKIVKDNFPTTMFQIDTITCKRTINSKNPESVTNELIIYNF